MGADAGSTACASVGFDLIAFFICVGCGVLSGCVGSEKFAVDFVLIGVIVGAHGRLAGAGPLLYFFTAFIGSGGSVGSSGGCAKMMLTIAAQ